jgi:hypothetical protein
MFALQSVRIEDRNTHDCFVVDVYETEFVVDIVFECVDRALNATMQEKSKSTSYSLGERAFNVTSALQNWCLGDRLPLCKSETAQFPCKEKYAAMQKLRDYSTIKEQERRELFYTVEQARSRLGFSDMYILCNLPRT